MKMIGRVPMSSSLIGCSYILFPLTPALSLRERENPRQLVRDSGLLHLIPVHDGALPLPGGLSLPTSRGVKSVNPEGIPSLSPGLRGTSYPGLRFSEDQPTPTGLYQTDASTGATPLGLRPIWNGFPRVARASQPWAELCNPFGIARARVPKLWAMISPEGEGRSEWESLCRGSNQDREGSEASRNNQE